MLYEQLVCMLVAEERSSLWGICLLVDGDVFECLREVLPFNVIVVTLRECCAPQARCRSIWDLTCSS